MQRFYRTVSAELADGGYRICLDGRPVRTPDRADLLLPNKSLADAICAEWDAQTDKVNPATMPFTGFANAAIDKIRADRDAYIGAIAAFGESDTLCYRAEPEEALSNRQHAEWEPLLNWAEARFDIHFVRISGIVFMPQPEPTLQRLRSAIAVYDDFMLAALVSLAGLTGSVVATLALAEQAFPDEVIWNAVNLEELWQAELWGADYEAIDKRERRRAEFDLAVKFCNEIRVP